MIFNLYAVVRNFAVKVAHSLIGSFFLCLFFYVAYVYNDCHWRNQNHRSKMGLTSHLSDDSDAFSSSCASFSLLLIPMTMTPTNQMETVQVQGYFPVFTFCYVLNYLLIESFYCCLVESYLVKSHYFQYFCSAFPAQKLFQFQFPNF